MNSVKIYFSIIFLAFVFCKSQEEPEEEDYSDDVAQKVAKLRVEGAEYLQKVMQQLQNDRMQIQAMEVPDVSKLMYSKGEYEYEQGVENYAPKPIYNITGPTPVPGLEAEIVPQSPPPLSLSKEELIALYEAALVKATQLQNGESLGEGFSHASPEPTTKTSEVQVKPALQGQMGSPVSGYYYYYFPIKSFLKQTQQVGTISKSTPAPSPTTAPQQLHATITMMESPNNKSVEPLFMAISGFIGMALMFFFSVLFVPKFSKIRSKNAQFKDASDEMSNFAQIILESMAGRDCNERLACEVTRIFRGLKSNNKPLRVLEIILPPNLAQKITHIRKAAGKKAKCSYIPCKMKKPKPSPENHKPQAQNKKPQGQNQNRKPWKKKETPHDLWMKHFEKENMPVRRPQQQKTPGWNRKPPSKKPK